MDLFPQICTYKSCNLFILVVLQINTDWLIFSQHLHCLHRCKLTAPRINLQAYSTFIWHEDLLRKYFSKLFYYWFYKNVVKLSQQYRLH